MQQSDLRFVISFCSTLTVNLPVTIFSGLCYRLNTMTSFSKRYSYAFSAPEAHIIEWSLQNLSVWYNWILEGHSNLSVLWIAYDTTESLKVKFIQICLLLVVYQLTTFFFAMCFLLYLSFCRNVKTVLRASFFWYFVTIWLAPIICLQSRASKSRIFLSM